MKDIAIELCKAIYDEMGKDGIFPALTGGCLYKEGERKDIDIVLYFKRYSGPVETSDIAHKLKKVGLTNFKFVTGYVTKAKYGELDVDLLNPETQDDSDY